MWRQGDVLIEAVTTLPTDAAERGDLVLAEGIVTGHRHQVEETEGVKLFERGATLYLDVTGPRATITHPEHASLVLRQGRYRIWRQREYTGETPNRVVMD